MLLAGEPVDVTVDVLQKTFDLQCTDEEGACTEDEVKWTFKDSPVVTNNPKVKEYEIFPNCTLRLLKIGRFEICAVLAWMNSFQLLLCSFYMFLGMNHMVNSEILVGGARASQFG